MISILNFLTETLHLIDCQYAVCLPSTNEPWAPSGFKLSKIFDKRPSWKGFTPHWYIYQLQLGKNVSSITYSHAIIRSEWLFCSSGLWQPPCRITSSFRTNEIYALQKHLFIVYSFLGCFTSFIYNDFTSSSKIEVLSCSHSYAWQEWGRETGDPQSVRSWNFIIFWRKPSLA
jgi:hypothetical protein